MRSCRRGAARAVLVLVLCSGLLATAIAPASARSFGSEPVDDVLAAASKVNACGLHPNAVAALVLAPTYPETGSSSGSLVPSPMTLSRYDNQAALHAFGNTDAAYAKAFWHAGVGAWQFDSAGGRPYAAQSYISTDSAADLAATEMARRYCQAATNAGLDEAGRRAYAWAPWVACTKSPICETIFNELYDPGTQQLRNLTRDTSVTRWGGMEPRSCKLTTVATAFLCWYVDPAKAQGNKAFTVSTFGPSPVTAPFYVYGLDGREVRHWLVADTGYDKEISASKPLTANARTSLTWSDAPVLCDQTAFRGTCDVAPLPKRTRQLSASGAFEPVVGDFRAVGQDDILWFSATGGDLLWRSTPDGNFTTQPISVAGSLKPIVGDYDGDGHDDIYWFSPTQGDALYRGTADGFSATYPNSNGAFTPLTGDFNGDGQADIYWFSPTGGDAIYYGMADGGFVVTYPNSNGDFTGHVGDFNGDQVDDIYWFSPYGGDAIYYGSPSGFTATYPNANGSFTVVPGDFDGDSIDDLYWFSPTQGDALYYGNPTGFTAIYPNANGPYLPVLIDLDGPPGDDIVWYAAGPTLDAAWRSTGDRSNPFTGVGVTINGSYRPVPGQFDSGAGRDVLWFDSSTAPDPLWYG